MASAIESQGCILSYQTGSPLAYVAIANVVGFDGPGGSASVIDATNLASTAKEKMMGLPDEGQFTLELNFDPDQTTHTFLRTARANRTLTPFKITFTDLSPSDTATFSGYVLGFRVSGNVDQIVKANVTIEVSGAVTWSA